MKPFRIFKRVRSRKGVSILETAIALTVITIMSAAVISLFITSIKTESKNLDALYISAHAENATECFRYADDIDELLVAMKTTDDEYTVSDGKLLLKKSSYEITITVDFDSGSLSFLASKPDGKELYSLNYERE